jgi:phosphohistidine phosphatase
MSKGLRECSSLHTQNYKKKILRPQALFPDSLAFDMLPETFYIATSNQKGCAKMRILIVRHAIAELREDWHEADEQRPLTAEGRKRMARIVRGLRNLEVEVTHLYASPLVRAQQTAEIIQNGLKIEKILSTDLLVPEADPVQILPFLNVHDDQATLALVGHEPHVSALLAFLVAGETAAIAPFKKGGVALVEGEKPLRAGQLLLRWLLEPNQLVGLGKK